MKPKKIVSVMSAILMTLCIFTSCGNSSDDQSSNVEISETVNNSSVFEQEDKKITLMEITSTGEIPYEHFKKEFLYGDNIAYFKTELFPYLYNSKFGFADANGNIVISEKYDEANYFSEEKAFVKEGDIWKVIDVKGQELYTVPNGYNCSYSFFQNGKAIIVKQIEVDNLYRKYDFSVLVIDENMQSHEFKKVGGMNLQTKKINTAEFSGVMTCHLASYPDSSSNTGYKYEYVYILYDINGSEVWTVTIPDKNNIADTYFDALGSVYRFEYEGWSTMTAFHVEDGYMNVVDKNKKWGLLNLKTGSLAIPCKYDFVGSYSEGLVPICSYDKWGYADAKGNVVITPTYNYTEEFNNGRAFIITDYAKPALIDKSGIIKAEYNFSWDDEMNEIAPFSEKTGIAVYMQGDNDARSYNLITSNGEILLQRSDCKGAYVSDNYAFVDGHMYQIQR